MEIVGIGTQQQPAVAAGIGAPRFSPGRTHPDSIPGNCPEGRIPGSAIGSILSWRLKSLGKCTNVVSETCMGRFAVGCLSSQSTSEEERDRFMAWTEEKVELLKKLWCEQYTACQVAEKIGGVTRNAVIGKAYRLKLKKPPLDKPERESTKKAGKRKQPEPARIAANSNSKEESNRLKDLSPARKPIHLKKPILVAGRPLPPQPSLNEVSPEELENVKEVEKTSLKISLMELTERTCKWPIGDPSTPEFWFCGLPSLQGKPYCQAHERIAYQPLASRRERRTEN